MKYWSQSYFPEANSEMALRLFSYHDLCMVVVVPVMVLVLSFLLIFLFSGSVSMDLKLKKCEYLECVWTIAPGFVLVFLGVLSLQNLYSMEVGEKVEFAVKVVGHQWYWEYCYQVSFDDEGLYESLKNGLWEWLKNEESLEGTFFGSIEKVVSPELDESGLEGESCLEDSEKEEILKKELGLELGLDGEFCLEDLEKAEMLARMYNTDLWKIGPAAYPLHTGKGLHKFNIIAVIEVLLSRCEEESRKKSLLLLLASLFVSGDWVFKYDSFLVPENFLSEPSKSLSANFRNQDVSVPCYLPAGTKVEVLVSTADVMHSWGVPELGVKVDAVPGRVNGLKVEAVYPGLMTGFCYELCGVGHSQMPIEVLVLLKEDIDCVIYKNILMSEVVQNGFSTMSWKWEFPVADAVPKSSGSWRWW